jgi:hypothetical protein
MVGSVWHAGYQEQCLTEIKQLLRELSEAGARMC